MPKVSKTALKRLALLGFTLICGMIGATVYDPCRVPWRDFIPCACFRTCLVGSFFDTTIEKVGAHGARVKPEFTETPKGHEKDSFVQAFIEESVDNTAKVIDPVVNATVDLAVHSASYVGGKMLRGIKNLVAGRYVIHWVTAISILLIVIFFLVIFPYKYVINRVRAYLRYKAIKKEGDVRVLSNLKYDEHGPHLVHKNAKIYFSSVTEMKPLVDNPVSITLKESLLATSVIEASDKAPAFIGEFYVGNKIVGMFSRIMYQGKHAILTACHVLEMHNLSGLYMGYKEGKLPFENNWKLLAYSSPQHLDFAIVEVPAGYFSQLGMKLGQINTKFGQRIGVALYGYKDDQISMSIGTAAPLSVWRLKYGASTMPSWSGTPILDSRHKIIGIHTEASCTGRFNVGTALPVELFNNKESYAESPAYQDVTSENGEQDEREEFDVEFFTENSKHKYKVIENDKYRHKREELDERAQSRTIGWGAYMDELDDLEINYKETITLCPKCFLAQEHNRVCVKCGFIADKMTEQQLIDKVKELLRPVRDSFSSVLADTKIIDMSLDAVVERYRKKGLLVKALNEMTKTGHLPTQDLHTSRTKGGANLEPLDVTPDVVVSLATNAKVDDKSYVPIATKVHVPNKNEAIVTQVATRYELDEPKSLEEGGVVLDKVKEAVKVNLKIRRRRKNPNKESLNSSVPSQGVTGTTLTTPQVGQESCTPGPKSQKSIKNSQPLVTPIAPTMKAPKPAVQKSGTGSSSSIQSGPSNLSGLSAAQLQSLVVSATSLLAGKRQ
jgi:hypothetical protein